MVNAYEDVRYCVDRAVRRLTPDQKKICFALTTRIERALERRRVNSDVAVAALLKVAEEILELHYTEWPSRKRI